MSRYQSNGHCNALVSIVICIRVGGLVTVMVMVKVSPPIPATMCMYLTLSGGDLAHKSEHSEEIFQPGPDFKAKISWIFSKFPISLPPLHMFQRVKVMKDFAGVRIGHKIFVDE